MWNFFAIIKSSFHNAYVAISYFFQPHPRAENWSMHRKLLHPSWYHDFSTVGIQTSIFPGGEYRLSQEDKQNEIMDMLQSAANEYAKQGSGKLPTMIDLFCADAYYSIRALKMGHISFATGYDLEQQAGEGKIRMGVLEQAKTIRKLVGLEERLHLVNEDVMNYEGEYDICLCAGGLYHISDPAALIERISSQTRNLLVIQTVLPLHISDLEPFFVAPAPHWTWGSRFNRKWLEVVLAKNGWVILDHKSRTMRANEHDWDKVSITLLCIKESKLS